MHLVSLFEILSRIATLQRHTKSLIILSRTFHSASSDSLLLPVAEPSEPALHRLNRYLRSAGRYGPSPFLVAQFGGVGEITQSFCRACAVHGGTYILGAQGRASRLRVLPLVEGEGENSDQDRKGNDNQQAKENEDEDDKVQVQVQVQGQDRTNRPRVEVTIPAQSKPITASHLIMPNTTSSRNILTHAGVEFPSPIQSSSSTTSVNLVAILPALPSTLAPYLRQKSTNADEGEDGEENEPSEDDLTVDAAFVIFPPTSDQESVVRCLLVGEGTGSCPAGQCEYIEIESVPEIPGVRVGPFWLLTSYLCLLSSPSCPSDAILQPQTCSTSKHSLTTRTTNHPNLSSLPIFPASSVTISCRFSAPTTSIPSTAQRHHWQSGKTRTYICLLLAIPRSQGKGKDMDGSKDWIKRP